MKKYNIICPICETKYEGNTFDNCPTCEWMFWGGEEELKDDEYDSANFTTKRRAKQNFAKGLNIWGKPLQKETKPNHD